MSQSVVSLAKKNRNQPNAVGFQLAPDLMPVFFGHQEVPVLRYQRAYLLGHAATEVVRTGAEGDDGDLGAFAKKPPEQRSHDAVG